MPPHSGQITVIVLASGFSRRLGSNKLLKELDGRAVIELTLENAIGSDCDEVVAVIEPGNKEVAALIPNGVMIVENPDRSEGISSSIRTGLNAVWEKSQAVIFLNGDQPFLPSGVINAMIERFRKDGCRIVACYSEGEYVNPMLFSSEFFTSLAEIRGDSGARKLAIRNRDELCKIVIDNPALLHDIDTADDLKQALDIYKKKDGLFFEKK